MSNENDPKIRNSQNFSADVPDFELADQNRKLKDVIKVMADSLRNGESISAERLTRLKTAERKLSGDTKITVLLAVISAITIVGWGTAYAIQDRELSDMKQKLNQASGNHDELSVEKSRSFGWSSPDQKASVDYWRDRAKELRKELYRLSTAPPSLKEADLREQLEKLRAEKAELKKNAEDYQESIIKLQETHKAAITQKAPAKTPVQTTDAEDAERVRFGVTMMWIGGVGACLFLLVVGLGVIITRRLPA